jgi:Tfp pilus assembly protein PilN
LFPEAVYAFTQFGLPVGSQRGFLPVNNSLNLASRPFSNRIVPWALTVIILFVSLIGLLIVVQLTTSTRKQADLVQGQITQLKQREQVLLDAAKQVQQAFTPEQQQALPAAHELVDRKSFSWSRLLADLESSLPSNVRVSRIAVRDVTRAGGQTVAQLDLAVFAKNPSTISEMMTAWQKDGVFLAELRNQNLQKGRGETGTEYELAVIYRARAGYSSENVAEVDASRKESEVQR